MHWVGGHEHGWGVHVQLVHHWAVDREVLSRQAILVRAQFEANRNVSNLAEAEKMLDKGFEKLAANEHPDPYRYHRSPTRTRYNVARARGNCALLQKNTELCGTKRRTQKNLLCFFFLQGRVGTKCFRRPGGSPQGVVATSFIFLKISRLGFDIHSTEEWM